MGNEAESMIKKVSRRLANQLNMSQSVAASAVYNYLGVILARGNALYVCSSPRL